MEKKPISVTVSRGLLLLFVFIWFGFGTIVAFNLHPALPDEPLVKGILSIGAFLLAAILLVLWFLLKKKNRWAYYSSLAIFGASFLATFLDDVGWADLIFLSLSSGMIFLLLKDRKWYLERNIILSVH